MATVPNRAPGSRPKVPRLKGKDWRREFEELGVAAVRAGMRGNEWSREKKAAARVWADTADAHAWQQKHKAEDSKTPLMLRIRSSTFWRYAVPAFGTLMGIGVLLRRLKAF